MTYAASWTLTAHDGLSRAGVLSLTHGDVETPTFMPVGTRASVKGLDSTDVGLVGAQMVLANTYHLMLRPGAEVIDELGGLHGFMGWDRPTLTDSGGYQIFSLDPTIDETGATFRSTYDGSIVHLTPEESVRVQQLLGADVAMVLDVLVGLPNRSEVVREALDRTVRWAERALAAHNRPDQALFGIVQGGVDLALRVESARKTSQLGFCGFGIGGLAVGEEPHERNAVLDVTLPELPAMAPRYVMGLGDPEGVMDAVARGADLFDCVWPTRLARHGKILTADGDYNLRRAEFSRDPRPLEEDCQCHTCSTVSRAYLRHLLMTNELSAFRLLSMHNLTFTLSMMAGARRAILTGRMAAHHAAMLERRQRGMARRSH